MEFVCLFGYSSVYTLTNTYEHNKKGHIFFSVRLENTNEKKNIKFSSKFDI